MAYASVTNLEVSAPQDDGVAAKSIQYCLLFEDDFKTLDTNVWNHEIQRD